MSMTVPVPSRASYLEKHSVKLTVARGGVSHQQEGAAPYLSIMASSDANKDEALAELQGYIDRLQAALDAERSAA